MGFFLQNQGSSSTKRRPLLKSNGKHSKSTTQALSRIPLVEDRSGKCEACTLLAVPNHHPQMEPTGSDKPWLYILGEAPGADEDEQGIQFVGKSGRTIRDPIPVALAKHVRWNNSVRCRPPENRTPTARELRNCSRLQIADIEETKPPIVALLGGTALEWALGETKITQWRGLLVPAQIGSHKCLLAPVYHPSYVNRKKHDKKEGQAVENVYLSDIHNLFDLALRTKG